MAFFPLDRFPRMLDSSDENIRRAVKELAPIVQEEVRGHSWVTIDLLSQYSPALKMYRPAFVITASEIKKEYWIDVIIPRIRQRFRETQHDFDVWLWTVEDFSSLLTVHDVYEPNAVIEKRFYNTPRGMGTSCGLQGRGNRSGTWGGKVVLEKDGEEIELGLTNSHVLLKDAFKGNAGPFPPGTFKNDYLVVSPSDRDHENTLVRMKNEKTAVELELEKLEARGIAFGELDYRYQDFQIGYSGEKISLISRIRIAERDNREIGTLYAASGFTQATFQPPEEWPEAKNWTLDWALFEVRSDHRHRENDMAKPLMEWGYVKPHTEYKVTKQGRTSGKTECRISGFDSIHERPKTGLPNIRPAADLEDDLVSPASVHVVFPKVGQSRVPLDPGDSGSLILEDRGVLPPRVLGLGFASHKLGYSYMMPAELLVRSIEEVTGGKVLGFVDY